MNVGPDICVNCANFVVNRFHKTHMANVNCKLNFTGPLHTIKYSIRISTYNFHIQFKK